MEFRRGRRRQSGSFRRSHPLCPQRVEATRNLIAALVVNAVSKEIENRECFCALGMKGSRQATTVLVEIEIRAHRTLTSLTAVFKPRLRSLETCGYDPLAFWCEGRMGCFCRVGWIGEELKSTNTRVQGEYNQNNSTGHTQGYRTI